MDMLRFIYQDNFRKIYEPRRIFINIISKIIHIYEIKIFIICAHKLCLLIFSHQVFKISKLSINYWLKLSPHAP